MTEKARQLGATICLDVTEVGDFGWMSVFTDPTGATLALWQPRDNGDRLVMWCHYWYHSNDFCRENP